MTEHTFHYPVFANTTEHGPRFIAGIVENGVFHGLTCSASTAERAVADAKGFADRNPNTPERLARIAERVAKAAASRAKKKGGSSC